MERKVKKSKGYLKVCLALPIFPSVLIGSAVMVLNLKIHIFCLHSQNEARKARKLEIQLHFIIILPPQPFHKFAPIDLQKLYFSIVYSSHYQISFALKIICMSEPFLVL